jgi:1,2-dihydroxy-3-keto-5-methylthiopentene dioxygenase
MKAGEELECTDQDLSAEGIRCEAFDTAAVEHLVERLLSDRGWTEVEHVRRSATKPQDEAEIVKEADEHCHLEDEVRLLLEGQGLYDIRAHDEQWLRIWVRPGDLVVVPARRYHRFLVGHAATLYYVQPYASRSDLLHLYRVSEDTTRAG